MLTDGVCIIDDNDEYIFDRSGRFSKKGIASPLNARGMLMLPLISVLSANNSCEIAVFNAGNDIRKFSYAGSHMDFIVKLQMSGGFLRMLQNNGVYDDIRYNQMVFIYADGTDVIGKVTGTGAVEVE